MRTTPLTLSLVLCATAWAAPAAKAVELREDAPLSPRGFSYFVGLGWQSAKYDEAPRTQAVRSSVRTTSPLLITGALYAVKDDLLFSMDSVNTFYPARSTETWRATGASFNGVTLTDPVLQTNGYSLNQSTTQLLAHARLRGPWFATAGGSFRNQSFKRFDFAQGADQAVAVPSSSTAIEEAVSEVVLNLGLALESERVLGESSHHGVRLELGLPAWRRVTNTSVPQALFSGLGGWDANLSARWSWALLPAVHLGLWGQFSHLERPAQIQGGNELPRNRQNNLGAGVELLWKL